VRRWLAAHHKSVLLALILAAAAGLRLYGLNWDGGQWLHPDERQIYFVTLSLGWPHSLAQALSPASPLNPHFFAYGSLPIYLLKIVAALLAPLSPVLRDPDNLHLVGRPLAVLFDLGTVFLTYRLAKVLGIGYWVSGTRDRGSETRNGAALVAAALVGFAVLSVQLAHFYTADTLLTFFVVLSLNLAADVAQGGTWRRQIALGVAVGLALATKVSALPLLLLVPVALSFQRSAVSGQLSAISEQHAIRNTQYVARLALVLAATSVVFFVAQPYALIDWQTFLADTVREAQIARGTLDVPYTRQYAGTLPYLYPMWQTALWGLGLPLGLVAWGGFAAAAVRWLRHGQWADTLLLVWAGPYLLITGLFHARYLRYMLPLVPVLCVLVVSGRWSAVSGQRSAVSRQRSAARSQRLWVIGHWTLVICTFAYSLLFASMYATPHSWISASEWIYANVPAGGTLAVEDWDTALPLPLDVNGQARRIDEYDVRTLTLYDEPDDTAKWSALSGDLAASDYVIIASRRLYGSIPRLPDRYPLASRYYDRLFAGDLGFELVGEFTRGAAWLNPHISPLPDAAPPLLRPDESFVVYDHPRVLILQNAEHLSPAELLRNVAGP
jgi:4-amino-4-deoxy-L-arabinose transferase-like glycosyltransferase